MNRFTPMMVIAIAVGIGLTGVMAALIISVVQGGPPDALSEGAFAVLSAAIGAVAGYSVASREPDDEAEGDEIIDITDEMDDEDDDGFVDDDGDFVTEDVAAPSQDWIEDALKKEGDDRA